MTENRVKRKDPPNPRNPSGKGSDRKFKSPQPGTRKRKRDATQNEKDFIKKHHDDFNK